ncbi:hypothetical protein HYW11_03910 [Candidatus Peregrinibacteria bacterium]|nr:hypothetical protein [Candidatus Peregrinibacteria bacterium]
MSLSEQESVEASLEQSAGSPPRVYDFWTLRERLLELGVSEEHLNRHMPNDPEDFANHS